MVTQLKQKAEWSLGVGANEATFLLCRTGLDADFKAHLDGDRFDGHCREGGNIADNRGPMRRMVGEEHRRFAGRAPFT
jgi:hypothetical protein